MFEGFWWAFGVSEVWCLRGETPPAQGASYRFPQPKLTESGGRGNVVLRILWVMILGRALCESVCQRSSAPPTNTFCLGEHYTET